MLYIQSAALLTPKQTLADRAVLLDGGRVVAVGPTAQVELPPGVPVLDADGLYLAPGFIDLHLNGGFGHDFTAAPETIWEVGARLPEYGVTAFLPTIAAAPPDSVPRAQAVLRQGPPPGYTGAVPLGLHVEDRMLSRQPRGAYNPAYLREPSLKAVGRWAPEDGVRLVTLAPELPGALKQICSLTERGVLVSAGQWPLNCKQAQAALAGSVVTLDQAVRNLVTFTHCPPGEAVATVTDVPARLLGLKDRGRVEAGQAADLVLLTPDLRVAATVVRGELFYRVRERARQLTER